MAEKIVTMGEIMMRLSPPENRRFVQADSFAVVYGGGEANVAVSLANFGLDSYFVTKLPQHQIGQAGVNALRRYGVKTDYIARGGQRLGIYFAETGASVRASQVIYDRAQSAIALADKADFDFDQIFSGARWFHWTGITPAISDQAAELIEAALQAAVRHQVTVSVDLNYRKKLWSPEKARRIMTKLMQYVDVCIGNEEDADITLGFKPGKSDVTAGQLDLKGYENIFKRMVDTFGFKYVGSTLRESHSASDNGWSACFYDGQDFYHSRRYNLHIVDRVGGGDSFAAGLIYSLIKGKPVAEALEFAVAASALKHTISGDFNLVDLAEVERLVQGDGSGRVQR